MGIGFDRGEGSGPAAEDPASWGDSFAGAGLYLLLPALGGVHTVIFMLLGGQGSRYRAQYQVAGTILLGLIIAGFMAVACTAWIRGFPRWSFPYLGFGLLVSLLMRSTLSPGTTILGHETSSLEKLLWRAFVPTLIVVAVALVATRSVQPLRQLAHDTWNDWSRISFALYGMLPIPLLLSFDEARSGALVDIGLPVLLGIGALAYMRSTRLWQRVVALLSGLTVTWLAATVWLFVYWNGRQDPWMSKPADGYRTAAVMSRAGAILLVLLLAPGLVGLAHWAVRRRRPLPT